MAGELAVAVLLAGWLAGLLVGCGWLGLAVSIGDVGVAMVVMVAVVVTMLVAAVSVAVGMGVCLV